jgi:PAS domain S-box-containing protein
MVELGLSQPQLLRRPGRLFPELDALPAPVDEVLMTPLVLERQVIGTIWAVHHRPDAHFDLEDARLLERLGGFAAVAWRLHHSAVALREQQTQTSLALEATGVGVFRYDARSGRQAFSPRLLSIWGLRPDEEPTAERIRALVHPDDRHAVEAVAAALDPQGSGQFAIEHRIVRPDGEVRWVEARGQTEFADVDGARRALRCVGTMLDVTERHRAQEDLLESRERFATLVDSLPQLAWSARADGYTDYLSPQWLAYTGQTLEQSIGFGWTTALHPDDVPRVVEKWKATEGPGDTFESELRIRRTDGEYRWFLARATAMKSGLGRTLRWYGTCTDIDLTKRVQEALARREAQLELATRIVGAGVFDHDYVQGTIYWSPRLREIHELPDGAAPSLAMLDQQILPEDRAAHRAASAAAGDPAGDGVFTSEYRMRRRDGEVRWILARAQTWFDGEGAARRRVRTVGVEQDITDRKRIEAALRASEQRFIALADSVPVLARTTDAAGDCDYLNRRWHEYTGHTPQQATGQGWFDAVHPDDRGPITRLWAHSLRTGEPLEAEYRLRRHDGAYRWFSARASAQRGADGRIERWFGTSSDVDEIRRLVIASENVAERLRLATDAAQLGILEYFIDGRRHWDARARALWGIGPDEPITYDLFMSRIHPEDRGLVEASIERVLDPQRSSGRYEAEYRVVDDVGIERWVRATGNVQFEDGRPHHVIGTVQDVSGQKAIEAALRAADRRKDEFLATLAHELRNPLAPIRNAAQILASPKLDEAALHWSRQVIQRQVTHMAWLLDDLLDVARITQGKLELRRERITLGAVIETAVEAARPLIDGKRHVLAVELPAPDVEIDADPLRLAQVISNLLTNAAKYTDPGGRIAVLARVAPPNLVVTVRDTGIGISPGALRSIFEMFSQVADTKMIDVCW